MYEKVKKYNFYAKTYIYEIRFKYDLVSVRKKKTTKNYLDTRDKIHSTRMLL